MDPGTVRSCSVYTRYLVGRPRAVCNTLHFSSCVYLHLIATSSSPFDECVD